MRVVVDAARADLLERLLVDGVVPRATAAMARFRGDTTGVVAVVVLHVRGVHEPVPLGPLPEYGVICAVAHKFW
jgi:hypothetical protein